MSNVGDIVATGKYYGLEYYWTLCRVRKVGRKYYHLLDISGKFKQGKVYKGSCYNNWTKHISERDWKYITVAELAGARIKDEI